MTSNAPALHDLESALTDACLMVGIAADRLEDMFNRPTQHALGMQPNQWHIGQQDIERTLFAAYQAQRMVEDVKEAYLAALHAPSA